MIKNLLVTLLSFSSIIAFSQDSLYFDIKEGMRPIMLSIESGHETKGQEDIKSLGLKIDFSHYHRDRFATSIEVKSRWYKGMRSEVENNTLAIGLGYAIKYHFFANEKNTTYIDCGFGAIYSVNRFPSRGTHVNGQYYYGLGSYFNFSKLTPFIGLRYFHSSNGRGFVTDNPAFDGLFLSIGLNI